MLKTLDLHTFPLILHEIKNKITHTALKQMKNLFIKSVAMIALTATSCSAPSYFGKSYAPTQHVDVFFDINDIKKEYEVMGTTDIGKGFGSIEAAQQKVITLGQSKGADAVVMKLTEEVTGSSKSDFGNLQNGKKNI